MLISFHFGKWMLRWLFSHFLLMLFSQIEREKVVIKIESLFESEAASCSSSLECLPLGLNLIFSFIFSHLHPFHPNLFFVDVDAVVGIPWFLLMIPLIFFLFIPFQFTLHLFFPLLFEYTLTALKGKLSTLYWLKRRRGRRLENDVWFTLVFSLNE